MQQILSATGELQNYALAKWLDEKLKLLSCIPYTISDTFSFAEEIRDMHVNENNMHLGIVRRIFPIYQERVT